METELKFQIPEPSRAALRRAVATARAQRVRLAAVYLDTADRALATAGLALRLRREDTRWVQTLKGRGDGLADRLEHEVALSEAADEPPIELARHAGTRVGALLDQALGGRGAQALQEVYRTEVQRTLRRVRHGGAVLELALDEGELLAAGRRAEVFELEIELKSGPPGALAELAARWALRHRLWWDVRTKSERGHRLAEAARSHADGEPAAADTVPASGAVAVKLARGASPTQALAAAVQAALQQVLPNQAEIASGAGAPEHLHQWRVGMRRLRTVLKLLGGWAGDPAQAQEAMALEAALREPFSTLGQARDGDVLAAGLWPRIEAAGGPPWSAPPPSVQPASTPPTPQQVLTDPRLSTWLLGCLALAMSAGAPAEPTSEGAPRPADAPLPEVAAKVLERAWKAVRRDAQAFAKADIERRHRLRRRMKRLRYAFEALSSLYPGKAARGWLRRLRTALDSLGALNDVAVAEDHARAQLEHQAQAWFALGWLAAQRQLVVADCTLSLRELRKATRPWR